MRVLLVSTYELGHQPLHLASPAAALGRAGHEVRCLDLSAQAMDEAHFGWAEAIGFSVPMHTAMRLAIRVARNVRTARPEVPTCFYGLYAPVSRDLTVGVLADRVIAGEYEPGLVAWVDALKREQVGVDQEGSLIQLESSPFAVPARDLLPPLDRYARLEVAGEERLVGYVEASHGCAHRCRHCPVPVVYDGRIRTVPRPVVLDDIEQLVGMGARHITFGDPDFLNGWRHSLLTVQEMHARWPELTFDCTTKVEHILRNPSLWHQLADAGCLFVVSALESVNDTILERLDKGHTTAQASAAIDLLRAHGIEVRPSLLPFTPWTTPQDLLDIMSFVVEHDLIENVDPVQYTIRLLLPEGSLLLEHPDMRPHLGPYDPEHLTYTWTAAHPVVDELQTELSALVERELAAEQPIGAIFLKIYRRVLEAAGHSSDSLEQQVAIAAGSVEEATAHRAVVLLSGTDRGPVRLSLTTGSRTRIRCSLMNGFPIAEPQETTIEEPTGSLEALDQANSFEDVTGVATRWPGCLAAWAALGAEALSNGRSIEAYAYFRVGYHRGLDRIRQAGWRGAGHVPWSHEPNRGFLRSLRGLGMAAAALGEQEEAARCAHFLKQLAPDA